MMETKKEMIIVKLKPAVSKIIAPMLEGAGYSLRVPGSGDYRFSNEGATRLIEFDHDKFAKKEVRVHFQVRSGTGNSVAMFYLNYLRPEFFPPICEEADDEYLRRLTGQIISVVIPYMDLLERNEVRVTRDMHEELAKDTVARAQRFAKRYGLSSNYVEHGKTIDEILWSMQPDIQRRKADFYDHLQDILDLAAYVGECMNAKSGGPGGWYWREPYGYCIEAQGYDVLGRVAEAWQAGREIRNYALCGLF